MATSGIVPSIANYSVMDIVNEAFAEIGIDLKKLTADQINVAIRLLRRLQIELVNRKDNQFSIDQETQDLTANAESFTAASGTIDIVSAVYRVNGQDVEVSQISRDDYLLINDKSVQGNPVNFFVDKTELPPTIYVWPVPNTDNVQFVYNRIRFMFDANKFTDTTDMTLLFIDAVISGLAARLAIIYKPEAYPLLQERYERAYSLASSRDNNNANLTIRPYLGRSPYYGGI